MICLFFFFSSRRRHTRWPRDWSSDVCSSDLAARRALRPIDSRGNTRRAMRRRAVRSEERRVGKECRTRWSPYHQKKKKKKKEYVNNEEYKNGKKKNYRKEQVKN